MAEQALARPLAAVDIGTSSLHLAIARPVPGGRPEIIAREKRPVRLGSGPGDMKTLDPMAVERAIHALTTFRAIADANGADVVAVATSAVREAEDPHELIDRARLEAGIEIEVISGIEEARLIHLGVLGALPIADERHLVIDVGGGSTELIVGAGREPILLRSLKVGHVRLTDRFFPGGVADGDSIERCRTFVRSFLARVAIEVRAEPVAVVVGCSGTFETMTEVARASTGSAERRAEVSRASVDAAVAEILSRRTPAERADLPGVEPHRADTIVAGAILVQALMESMGFEQYLLSPDALREGLVLDRLDRRDPSPHTLLHLDSIRSSSVHRVAERFGENLAHARQATDIALRIFDATVDIHHLADFERDILEAASMLHNIGRFVGHGAHHRHSYYLIRNTEHLAGFTEHERELIAQVARYHRKSEPKPTHAEFAALEDHDQLIVRTLAGMLRIGIALDRTYRNLATHLQIVAGPHEIDVVVIGEPDELELEIFAANERRGLLEQALARTVVVRSEPTHEGALIHG